MPHYSQTGLIIECPLCVECLQGSASPRDRGWLQFWAREEAARLRGTNNEKNNPQAGQNSEGWSNHGLMLGKWGAVLSMLVVLGRLCGHRGHHRLGGRAGAGGQGVKSGGGRGSEASATQSDASEG